MSLDHGPTHPLVIYSDAEHEGAVYDALVQETGCGPFDGGCVALAMALQRLYGGSLFALEAAWAPLPGLKPQAQHALLALPSAGEQLFVDGYGVGGEAEVVERFIAQEGMGKLGSARIRPLQDGDLMDARPAPEVVERLAAALDIEAWERQAQARVWRHAERA